MKQEMDFNWIQSPWDRHDPAFPIDWVKGWMQGGHGGGRARVNALAEVHSRLADVGVLATVLVSDAWLAEETVRGTMWRHGPWEAPSGDPCWAEGVGEADHAWVESVCSAFFASEYGAEPARGPSIYLSGDTVVFDASALGNRASLVLFRLNDNASVLVEHLLTRRATWWAVLMVAGMLHVDWFRAEWGELAGLLATGSATPWKAAVDHPVNPQEVTLEVAEMAGVWARRAGLAFGASAVSIYLPDPDEEYIYSLATHNCERHAYRAGDAQQPSAHGIGFGLTASFVMAPAWDSGKGPVVVRHVQDRAALHERYRDLGFDDELIAHDAPASTGPYQFERFVDPNHLAATRQGPWEFTCQRLPPAMSSTGRNLVIRLSGRTAPALWSLSSGMGRTGRDQKARLAMLSMRLHGEVVRLFAEGLALWRQGLRSDLLRGLTGDIDWASICRNLASWCSARSVTVWRMDAGELVLHAWSSPRGTPGLRMRPDEGLDAREMRLLSAPLYPERSEVGEDGFLAWPAFEDALGFEAENIGTVPIMVEGHGVGLLRIDGAMSLFAGHIGKRLTHGVLHQHRPATTPRHLRQAIEEAAEVLALCMSNPAAAPVADWSRFVAKVRKNEVPVHDIRARLDALYLRAPSRNAAAEVVGVHRNSFRRHLEVLERALDGDTPWSV